MAKLNGSLTSANISCFGVNQTGVSLATVLAHTCPGIQVSVVDLDTEKITLWNTKQITCREAKVEEMLKKTQNRNLVLTTKTEAAVKNSDIVFMFMDPSNHSDDGGKVLDITNIEEAVRIIIKVSDARKIIAIRNTVPVGTYEYLRRILIANAKPNFDLQLLYVPEFFSSNSTVSSLLYPEKIVIGSDLSEEALVASEAFASIYPSWVPRNKILTMCSQSAEVAIVAESAFLAQKVSDVSALSIVCEALDADVATVIEMIEGVTDIAWDPARASLGFRGSRIKRDLVYLVHMCEKLGLVESAEYWRQVLIMNELQERKFFRKIISSFFNSLAHKKIAVWGLAFQKNAEIPHDSLSLSICQSLINEGAKLNVCDPTVDSRLVINWMKESGLEKAVTYCDDPYKAARKTNAIIVLSDWEGINRLDYNLVYKDMLRPAHIFDGQSCLRGEDLSKIGFIVNTVGKKQQNEFSYL